MNWPYIQVLPSVFVHQDDPDCNLRGEAAWRRFVSLTLPFPYGEPT